MPTLPAGKTAYDIFKSDFLQNGKLIRRVFGSSMHSNTVTTVGTNTTFYEEAGRGVFSAL